MFDGLEVLSVGKFPVRGPWPSDCCCVRGHCVAYLPVH
jgi:hypothetical protein